MKFILISCLVLIVSCGTPNNTTDDNSVANNDSNQGDDVIINVNGDGNTVNINNSGSTDCGFTWKLSEGNSGVDILSCSGVQQGKYFGLCNGLETEGVFYCGQVTDPCLNSGPNTFTFKLECGFELDIKMES